MLTRRRAIALAAALSLAPLASAHAQSVTLRSADIHPDGYPTVEAVKYFGQVLEQKTNGKYKVQLFFAGQLGGEKETIEQTRFGVIDLNRVNTAPFNNLIPETAVLGLPFLFRDVQHMYKVVDGPLGDEIAKAQRDIEARLNELERAIGRPVIRMELESVDITTAASDVPRYVRHVCIEVPPPPGSIGEA